VEDCTLAAASARHALMSTDRLRFICQRSNASEPGTGAREAIGPSGAFAGSMIG
jgi:hypothetical protein